MALVIRHTKKRKILDSGREYLNTLVCRIFVNDISPDGDTVEGELDECEDAGYEAVENVGFEESFTNDDDQGETTAPRLLWQFDHNGTDFTVYGVYFTDPNDEGGIVMSERYATPLTVDEPGIVFAITPRVVLDTLVI